MKLIDTRCHQPWLRNAEANEALLGKSSNQLEILAKNGALLSKEIRMFCRKHRG